MVVALHVLAVVAGAAIVVATFFSAVATFVVPRGVPARLTRLVFRGLRALFDVRVKLARTYEAGESVMAWYAPLSLLLLVGTWLLLTMLGFTLVFRGLGVRTWALAFETAGSSLTTLGFVPVVGLHRQTAAFVDAGIGLLLLGDRSSHLGGARVWKDAAELPPLDLDAVGQLAGVVRGMVADGLLAGAHDVADGGLACTLGELVARSGLGLQVGLADVGELFSEAAGRVLLCVAPSDVDAVVARCGAVPVTDIGGVGGDRLVVDGLVDLPAADVVRVYRDTLPAAMAAGATH